EHRVRGVTRIFDLGALLLGSNLPLKVGDHCIEIPDHSLKQSDFRLLLADLKLLSANQMVVDMYLAVVHRALSQNRTPRVSRRDRPCSGPLQSNSPLLAMLHTRGTNADIDAKPRTPGCGLLLRASCEKPHRRS